MIASFYAYYNMKFKEFRFIDFNQVKLYGNNPVFKPIDDYYVMFIYNSNSTLHKQILADISDVKYKIIAIDIHQKIFNNQKNIIYLTSSTNNILNIIQTFNIYEAPASFLIKKIKDTKYKQDSKIKILTKEKL